MRIVAAAVAAVVLCVMGCSDTVASIEVSPPRLSFRGETEPKTLKGTPKDADGVAMEGDFVITWTSTNPAIATVDAEGRVRAKGSGKSTIKAEIGEAVGTAVVDVILVKSIKVETAATVVRVGQKTKPLQVLFLNEKNEPVDGKDAQLEWRSANPNLVTVDRDGSVVGVAPGSALLFVRVGELSADVSVTVLAAETPPSDSPVNPTANSTVNPSVDAKAAEQKPVEQVEQKAAEQKPAEQKPVP